MNARTRFLNALRGLPVDRPPVAAVVTGITLPMMEQAGVYWPEAHNTVDQLVALAETIWLHHGIESIKLPFDMAVESQGLGATLEWGSLDEPPTGGGGGHNPPRATVVPHAFFVPRPAP